MNRRSFLEKSTFGAMLPWALNGLGARAFGHDASAFLKALSTTADVNDRVLVVIQLNGGNDGLNTVIPLDQMGRYKSLRTNVAIPEEKVLKIRYREQAGLHPSLTGFQNLYNDGRLSILENVGYANPSFSHFQANDIWFRGVTKEKGTDSGWLGRYLDSRFTNYPKDYPNTQMPDPLAIQISAVASTALLGPNQSVALAIQDVDTFARLIGEKPMAQINPALNTVAKEYVSFVREQQTISVAYADQLKSAAGKGTNRVTYPAGNRLADQLKIVARLIQGGLQTKVYYVTLGGFDTHSNQVNVTDTATGTHANLMKQLGDAVKVFLDDLKASKMDDRVVGMTFSEFGRRALANGSRGTDHGWASPQFVFGQGIRTQWIGSTPNLTNLVNNNVAIEYDFRQMYASLLRDWFGVDEATVRTILLGKDYEVLPIFRETITSLESESVAMTVYPNPASDQAVVRWPLGEELREVKVIDLAGRPLKVPVQLLHSDQAVLDLRRLPAASYILHLETNQARYTKQLLVR
jgi:uncharacterized protein (DUF1501 family)